jgi:hypothetical protein
MTLLDNTNIATGMPQWIIDPKESAFLLFCSSPIVETKYQQGGNLGALKQ